MARNRCTCDGLCSCQIVGGEGIDVTGSGSATDPYRVDSTASGGNLTVQDTGTVDLTLSGDGSRKTPYHLSAQATVALNDLTDVETTGRNDGDTLTWVTDHWEALPPSTVPPGAVSTGQGLSGDGSQANPLNVRASGTWGVAPLDDYGSDSRVGQPVYIDADGNLRAEPKRDTAPNAEKINGYEIVVSETDPGNPASNRIWIQPV